MRFVLGMLAALTLVLACETAEAQYGYTQPHTYAAYYVYPRPAPIVVGLHGIGRVVTRSFNLRYQCVPAPGYYRYTPELRYDY